MFKLLTIALTLISLHIQPETVTIDVDTPVARIWAEIEISTGDVVQWGT